MDLPGELVVGEVEVGQVLELAEEGGDRAYVRDKIVLSPILLKMGSLAGLKISWGGSGFNLKTKFDLQLLR